MGGKNLFDKIYMQGYFEAYVSEFLEIYWKNKVLNWSSKITELSIINYKIYELNSSLPIK